MANIEFVTQREFSVADERQDSEHKRYKIYDKRAEGKCVYKENRFPFPLPPSTKHSAFIRTAKCSFTRFKSKMMKKFQVIFYFGLEVGNSIFKLFDKSFLHNI